MATSYIVKQEILIERQEGDTGSIVLTVPDIISMVDAEIKFGVFTQGGEEIFLKETADVTVVDQTITVPLVIDDNAGKKGTHVWELTVLPPGSQRITVGKGDFKIVKKWNP